LVTGLLSAIVANLPFIIQGGLALVVALISGIVTALPVLVQGALTLVTGLLTAIIGALPLIIQGGIQLLLALVLGIIGALPQLITAAVDLVMGLLQAIIDNLPAIIDGGVQLLLALVEGLINALPQLITAAVTLVLQLVIGLITMLPKLIEAGIQLVVSLIVGLVKAIPKIIKMLPQIVSAIWDGLAKVDWLSLGAQIVMGIINGLASMGKALLDAIFKLASGAFKAFKNFFGIKSPSKLMRVAGVHVVEGAVEGVNDEGPGFGDSLVAMAASASKRAQAAMSNVSAVVSSAVGGGTPGASSGVGRTGDGAVPVADDKPVELGDRTIDRLVNGTARAVKRQDRAVV
jgi:phage-related protein